jgi:hypothetical protein
MRSPRVVVDLVGLVRLSKLSASVAFRSVVSLSRGGVVAPRMIRAPWLRSEEAGFGQNPIVATVV